MQKGANPRDLHVGKSEAEKQAYQKFLRDEFPVEKTVEDPLDSSKTDSSSFEQSEAEVPKPAVTRKKSLLLKLRDGDFLNSPWTVTIIGGFIGAVLLFYVVQISISQGILSGKVENMQKDIERSKSNNDFIKEELDKLNLGLNISIEGIKKDIDFIKYILKL